MPLTLVLGPANSAKAGEVLGAYGLARGRGALLVVPTARDAEVYARELAADGAVLGGAVLTFSGLARRIARSVDLEPAGAGREPPTTVSPLQRERLLRRAVSGASLGPLARSADAPGFAAAALELIAELERSLITPRRFAAALGKWAAGEARREGYAHGLASIYGRYWSELDRIGRLDAELFAWRVLDALRAAPGRWGGAPVFFYGFDDLTPLERDAIETLARSVGAEVTVSLTYEAGRSALSARAEVVEELRAVAERVTELPALDRYYEAPVLHLLERRLFEEPGPSTDGGDRPEPAPSTDGGDRPEPAPSTDGGDRPEPAPSPDGGDRPDPGPAVRLLEAGGARAEAELVCAEVLELLKAGFAGEEIAVVYRSLASVAPLLERVFAELGVPVALERRVPFAHTSLGRGLLALARCALLGEEQASATDLVAYVRTPGAINPPERADRLEATVRREGLRSAAEARERSGLRFGELDALRGSTAPARELERQARRLLAAPDRGQAALLDDGRMLDARAVSVLARAVAELDELGESLSGRELIELLERLEVPTRTRGVPGAVLVAEPLQIRARRFRAVFVCGLQEGSFPAPGAPEPFLPDEWRRELSAASGLRLRPREDALARERYLFYSCLSRATERVVLSFRSSDEEGNIELPSPFVADVAELLAPQWFERRRRRLLADVVWPADEAPTGRERERTGAALTRTTEAGAEAAPGRRLSETALAHVRHREILSAGALESYASCPVKWLVERELQPERFEPDSDAMARGSFIHDLLEDLLRRLGRPVTPDSLAEAERIMEELLADAELPLARGRPESVRSAALRAVEADLRRYLRYEAQCGAGWKADAVELRFGFEDEEQALPALELAPGVRMRGVIDRVDVDGAGRAIVRDYKTGGRRAEFHGARWSEDRQLQVALYMRAVRELLGLEPVAGFYQPLGGDDLRARGIFLDGAPVGPGVVSNDARTPQELDEALNDARARALALAARLRSGDLSPCPETCSRDGCSHPGICRSEER